MKNPKEKRIMTTWRSWGLAAMLASVSASSSAMQPAGVTGPIAPARTAGTISVPVSA